MIKIEDSTVSLQDKTMYFNSPLFLLSHSQSFSKSFPRRRESPGIDSEVSGLAPWLLCLEQGTPAFAGVTDVMKAAGVTWSNEGLGNDLLTDEPSSSIRLPLTDNYSLLKN